MPCLTTVLHSYTASTERDELIIRASLAYMQVLSTDPSLVGLTQSRDEYELAVKAHCHAHFYRRALAFDEAFENEWDKFINNQAKESI